MLPIGTELESPQTGERLIIRSTARSSGGKLFQAELIAQPGSYVVRSHLHPSQVERFVVLECEYGYRVGARSGVAHTGETVVWPVGVADSQGNAGAGVMRVYYEHRPAVDTAALVSDT